MADSHSIAGGISIVGSSIGMFVGLYFLRGLPFNTYFMTYIILGTVTFLLPLAGWGIGLRLIAESSTS